MASQRGEDKKEPREEDDCNQRDDERAHCCAKEDDQARNGNKKEKGKKLRVFACLSPCSTVEYISSDPFLDEESNDPCAPTPREERKEERNRGLCWSSCCRKKKPNYGSKKCQNCSRDCNEYVIEFTTDGKKISTPTVKSGQPCSVSVENSEKNDEGAVIKVCCCKKSDCQTMAERRRFEEECRRRCQEEWRQKCEEDKRKKCEEERRKKSEERRRKCEEEKRKCDEKSNQKGDSGRETDDDDQDSSPKDREKSENPDDKNEKRRDKREPQNDKSKDKEPPDEEEDDETDVESEPPPPPSPTSKKNKKAALAFEKDNTTSKKTPASAENPPKNTTAVRNPKGPPEKIEPNRPTQRTPAKGRPASPSPRNPARAKSPKTTIAAIATGPYYEWKTRKSLERLMSGGSPVFNIFGKGIADKSMTEELDRFNDLADGCVLKSWTDNLPTKNHQLVPFAETSSLDQPEDIGDDFSNAESSSVFSCEIMEPENVKNRSFKETAV